MSDARFLGARIDGEIIFLDRDDGRLVRLNPRAAQVWEACAGKERGGSIPPTALPMPLARRILRDLSRAGVIRDVDGRWAAVPVTWV
jgi:hypothetical protein